MTPTFIVGIVFCVAFFFGGLASKLKFPKVTGYIVAGIVLNPTLFNFIPREFITHTAAVTDIALALITFAIGGTLLFPTIKKQGKRILYITFFEAEFAFLAVFLGSCAVIPFFIHLPGAGWLTVFIPVSLLLASLAAPTDPSISLAVIHQYKTKGVVTSTIMGVSAFDDVLAIINYSIAVLVAETLIMRNALNFGSLVLEPLIVIGGGILLGIIFGAVFNSLSVFVKEGSEGILIILILGLLSFSFGLAGFIGVDELLTTMVMGMVVVNFNKHKDKIFKILERYTEQLTFLLFFALSGMYLNLKIFLGSFPLLLLFFVFRTVGKIAGTMTGASLTKAPLEARKYTVGGLIPLGGIVVGLALMMKDNQAFSAVSDLIISIIIGSTVIHELIGPVAVKAALRKSGELKTG